MFSILRRQLMLRWERKYLEFKLPGVLQIGPNIMEKRRFEKDLDQISIEKPIFIIGCHRSGTTILYDTLTQYPDLAYFTNASAYLPATPIFSNWIAQKILGDATIERFVNDGLDVSYKSPSEGIRIWERYTETNDSHYLDENYDNLQLQTYLEKTIKKHLKYFQASRFINKNPDNSARIRYLNKIFPDAYFIHIIRDGRAVCQSLLKFRQAASDFFGADHRHATSGVKGKKWDEIQELWDSEPVKAIALLWLDVIETLECDRQSIDPNRYLEIRYEDFVAEPLAYLKKIITFCDLSWTPVVEEQFSNAAKKISLGDRNEAWKKKLSSEDTALLMSIIGTKMQDYRYQ